MATLLPEKWYETKFVGSPTPSGVRQGLVPEPTCGYPALLYSVLMCAYSHLELPGCYDAIAQIFDGHTILVPCMLVSSYACPKTLLAHTVRFPFPL